MRAVFLEELDKHRPPGDCYNADYYSTIYYCYETSTTLFYRYAGKDRSGCHRWNASQLDLPIVVVLIGDFLITNGIECTISRLQRKHVPGHVWSVEAKYGVAHRKFSLDSKTYASAFFGSFSSISDPNFDLEKFLSKFARTLKREHKYQRRCANRHKLELKKIVGTIKLKKR